MTGDCNEIKIQNVFPIGIEFQSQGQSGGLDCTSKLL